MAENLQAARRPPEIVSLPPFRVLGVRAYCGSGGTDVGSLWEGPFMESHDALKPLSVDGRYLGMAWEVDDHGGMFYMAGMVVPDDAIAPEGLHEVRFPASQWARFTFAMDYMQANAPEYAHQAWLPTSGWRRNPVVLTVDFTDYQGDTVLFYIPVVES